MKCLGGLFAIFVHFIFSTVKMFVILPFCRNRGCIGNARAPAISFTTSFYPHLAGCYTRYDEDKKRWVEIDGENDCYSKSVTQGHTYRLPTITMLALVLFDLTPLMLMPVVLLMRYISSIYNALNYLYLASPLKLSHKYVCHMKEYVTQA